MDENRYANDGQNYYQTSSTNFQQSQMNHQQAKPVKQKKQSSGFGKKVLAGLCCGLVFGVFAGIGFQAVDAAHSGINRAKSAFSAMIGNSSQDSTVADASDQEMLHRMQCFRTAVRIPQRHLPAALNRHWII